MKTFNYLLLLLILAFTAVGTAKESLILKAAKTELDRSMKELKANDRTPYFISYSIADINTTTIVTSFGKLKVFNQNKSRMLDIDLRVGNYNFDNTHIIRGSSFSFGSGRFSTELPIEDDEEAIRQAIWYATDRTFKKSIETYEKALTNKAVKVQAEDTSADFSREKPVIYTGEKETFTFDVDKWKSRLKNLSSYFNNHDWIFDGSVSFNAQILHKIFINSEGTKLDWYEPTVRVFISGRTKAEDGMNLPLYKSYFAFTPDSLPDEKQMLTDLKLLIANLKKLRNAETMSTYSGPAILSGEAAGVFFHEIFGHRVEGHRQKDPNSSQMFKGIVGEKILPDFINVVFNPHIRERDGIPLAGYYLYDDEGVEGRRVATVENGVFKGFLMSRSPIENFNHSNGHGRKQPGYSPVSRQSNLIVSSTESVAPEKLKDMLRSECRKQGKEFGLYFAVVQGGFTFTGRTVPNAFNVLPLLVYKIYTDGRPDEIVRGVDLIGTPLTTFKNVIATDNKIGIFNGICGAESGGVPVSASSPSLLVSQIEVQKKAKSQSKLPILPSPKIEKIQ